MMERCDCDCRNFREFGFVALTNNENENPTYKHVAIIITGNVHKNTHRQLR